MLTEIKNVADGALKGAVQSAAGNFIHNKAAELIKTKFIDPKQISSITQFFFQLLHRRDE